MQDREHHSSKLKGLAWLLSACVLGVIFALGLSPLAHAIPWSWEKALGRAFAIPVQSCPENPRAEALLARLVKRIYPIEPGDSAFSIKVSIAENPQINAFAALGGNIFVNSGLLEHARSPEEVAGVLAHEITHVAHRHIMEATLAHLLTSAGIQAMFGHSSAAGAANYFVRLEFSRAQEKAADKGGLIRLQEAHVDNRGFRNFFARMEASGEAPEFLSDHPLNAERIAMAEQFANTNTQPIMPPEEWEVLKHYCGK